MKEKNSYRLRFKEKYSECFNVSGNRLIHEEVTFRWVKLARQL